MAFDPQKSREARAETEQVTASPAAASNPSLPHSPAEVLCDLRGPQSATGRSAVADQPFADVHYISLGAAAALVVAGVLAILKQNGVIQ